MKLKPFFVACVAGLLSAPPQQQLPLPQLTKQAQVSTSLPQFRPQITSVLGTPKFPAALGSLKMGGGGVISVRTGAGAGQSASSSAGGQQVDPYPPPHGVERVGGSGGKCLVCGKVRLIFCHSLAIRPPLHSGSTKVIRAK